jgi:hypothetical protein
MLKEGGVNCIVYGISGNTVDQYKRIFSAKDVRAFLSKEYSGRVIGSYTVWIKNK